MMMEAGSMAVTAAQVRAARGLIAWSQTDLAKAAGVGKSTVADFERGVREPIKNNLLAMERALEEAGVSFTNGDEPGVKLRKAP
jgi:transcriptional regulator with XRE-family HTH domain